MSQFLTNSHYQRRARSSDDKFFHGEVCERLQLHGIALNALCHTLRRRIYMITHTYKQVCANHRYGSSDKEMRDFDYREANQPDEVEKLAEYRLRLRKLEICLESIRLQYQMSYMASRGMDSQHILRTHNYRMLHVYHRFAFNGNEQKRKEVDEVHYSLMGMQFVLDQMPFGTLTHDDLKISKETMIRLMQDTMRNIEALNSGQAEQPAFMSLFPNKK